MILIDPELELSLAADALNAGSAKPSAGPAAYPDRKLPAKQLRLPSTRSLTRTLAQFLKQAQAAVRLHGQVTVLLTNDAAMRDLNHRFRGKDKATDVLSFPASNLIRNQEKGDVAISVETARKQSVGLGHSLATEIKVLMLHGLLHLAGYDHENDGGEMQRREQRLRARLGLPPGLIERSAHTKRRATADPSTRSLRERAQDDKAKRASKPEKKILGSARDPRTARVPQAHADTARGRKP
jgi:probable rRNA maturation factor